ncbi:MAG: prefoldin subunit alpha [Candidatus Hadarchaeota archaeon]
MENERQRLQQVLAQLDSYRGLTGILREQISGMSAAMNEIVMTISTIEAMKDMKKDVDIMVPLGSDSFVQAKLAPSAKLVTGIGAEVVVERTAEEAIVALKAKAADLEKALKETVAEIEQLEKKAEALRPEAEELLEKMKKAQKPGTG